MRVPLSLRRSRILVCVCLFGVTLSAGRATPAVAEPVDPPGVTRVSDTIDIDCAATVLHQDSDWYFPAGPPRALVLLVHGFGTTKDMYPDIAGRLAADGNLVLVPTLPLIDPRGCALTNAVGNRAFLNNIADLFTHAADPDSALARSFHLARDRAGLPRDRLPSRLVLTGHSAGGDAVFHLAQRLATHDPATFAHLAGLVLFDPVRGIDPTVTDAALTTLATTSLPIVSISTPPAPCNSFASGTDAMRRLLPRPFLGVQVTTGSHADVFGTDLGVITQAGGMLCGPILPANTAVTRTLAVAWTHDLRDHTHTPDFYPGGSYFDEQARAGVITPLAGR